MIALDLEIELRVTPHPNEGRSLEELGDAVMQHLVELSSTEKAVRDPAVSLDAGRGLITIEVTVIADAVAPAEKMADWSIRSAMHAAGGLSSKSWRVERRAQHTALIGV